MDKCKGFYWPTTGHLHSQCRFCERRSSDQKGHDAPQWIGGQPVVPCHLRVVEVAK